MSSANHKDLKVEASSIERAANGGWLVYNHQIAGEFREVLAAVSSREELTGWLTEHLDNEPT